MSDNTFPAPAKDTSRTDIGAGDGEEEDTDQQDHPVFYERHEFSEAGQFDEEADKNSLWLITFTDIMALMLTFFVLLYTMAIPEEEKWSEMTFALKSEFNDFKAPAKWDEGDQNTINIDRVDFSKALDLDYLQILMAQSLQKRDIARNIVLLRERDRLIVSMPSDLLFETGQANVTGQGKRVLYTLGESLSRMRNIIEVVGHADPRPVPEGAAFNSNWHLSLARAAHVAGVLDNTGYQKPILVRGMSSARYRELSEDLPEDERLSLSRRVDIVILDTTGRQRNISQIGL